MPVAAAPAVIAPAMHCMHTWPQYGSDRPGGQALAGASAGVLAAGSRSAK
jgi:hypothetical protein